MATCNYCGETFVNAFQLGPHKRACWNTHQRFIPCDSDFSSCDSAPGDSPTTGSPPDSPRNSPPETSPTSLARAVAPAPPTSTLCEFACRPRNARDWGLRSRQLRTPVSRPLVMYNPALTHNYVPVCHCARIWLVCVGTCRDVLLSVCRCRKYGSSTCITCTDYALHSSGKFFQQFANKLPNVLTRFCGQLGPF